MMKNFRKLCICLLKHAEKRSWWALLSLFGVMLLTAATVSANEVFMLPDSNILWRTAPSSDFEVPVLMPPGASAATLTVTGHNYRREYTGIADGQFRVSLPAADSTLTENVYDITLTFNDTPSTIRHAKLAVVEGVSRDGTAEAFVRRADSSRWRRITSRAVLPVPAGADTMYINGQETPLDPSETPGWRNFTAVSGLNYYIQLSEGGLSIAEASLFGFSSSLKLIIR